MNKRDEIAELFTREIAEVCRLAQRTEAEQLSDSKDLVDAAVSLPVKRMLTVAELREGGVEELVHFDTRAAIVFLASLIEGAVGVAGMVGVGMWIAVSSAVVGCLLTLKKLVRRASRAEALVFLAVYESPYRVATRRDVELRFRELCEMEEGVVPEDFAAALQGLMSIGIVKAVRGRLLLADAVLTY